MKRLAMLFLATGMAWAQPYQNPVLPFQSSEIADPHVLSRGMVVEVPTAGGPATRQPGNPIKLSETHEDRFTAPPRLGEHTDAVLAELAGLGPEELAALRAAGVIG